MSFGFTSSYIAVWIWAIFQGLLTLAVLREVTELEKRVARSPSIGPGELPVGSRAPNFLGSDLASGRPIDSGVFDSAGGVILFLAANCPVCKRLARSFEQRATSLVGLPPMVAFCTGTEPACRRFVKLLGGKIPLLIKGANEIASSYRVANFPTALVVDGQRRVLAYSSPRNAGELKQLVVQRLGGHVDNHNDYELTGAGANSRVGA